MLTGIMFNDFPKNESIDMLTVNKVNGLVQYYKGMIPELLVLI